jgi:magnesium transporter
MPGMPPTQPNEAATHRVLPVETARRLLRRDAYPNLVRLLRKLHGSECAEILAHLTLSEQSRVLERIPDIELATTIFTYLDEDTRRRLIPQLSTARLVAIVRVLPPDDATDLLRTVSPERLQEMLEQLPETFAAELNKLLSYHPRTAGGLMTTDYFALEDTCTVHEALERLRRASQVETVFYVYVVDMEHRLVGVVSLRQLVMADPETTLRTLIGNEVVSIGVDEDQERIAQLITQYDFLALPVVDRSGRLVGIVTVDDIIDVISDEVTEDIQKFGGMEALDAPYFHIGFLQMVKKRAGWLTALFLGEMLTATAMSYFEGEIARAVVLALFVPLIISSGGNSGSQAATLIIRAMALGEVRLRDWWRVVRRELGAGVVLGTILGTIALVRILVWQAISKPYGAHYLLIAFTVASSLMGVVLFGTITGSMLPFVFRRLGLDPASASAPFVATLVDVTGLVIYFTVASVLLKGALL